MAGSPMLEGFPQMSRAQPTVFRKVFDGAYRNFSREYGEAIETYFVPLLQFLV
ncbi:hypothetical protein AAOGI_44970 [Agarivorans albus]